MRYWWVNHKQTFRHEVDGGYLWSPKRKANGYQNPYYDFMRVVAPGDVVLSFANSRIQAIGFVRSYCYEAPKPLEFGKAGAYWDKIGWRVDVGFSRLARSIRPADYIDLIRPLLPDRYAPLHRDGRGLQAVYLTSLDEALAGLLASENRLLAPPASEAERIVDVALILGEERTWNAVHLYDIADHMHIGLEDIERHFRNKDEIAEAWFRRADNALTACGNEPGWLQLDVRERLSRAIRAWLGALDSHKGVTVEMLRYKVQPDHIHLVIKGVLRTSATVQWVREVARVPSVGLRRELEEPALTAIFLSTLALWLTERTPGTPRAFKWLDAQLKLAERIAQRLPSPRAREGSG